MSNNLNPTVLLYPKCGTCQKAEKWLKSNQIAFTNRAIKEQNPTEAELKEWISKSGLPVTKFFNTSGLLYKEQNMKDKVKVLPENELIQILASNGLMVKRPIVVVDHKVLVGFKEDEWNQLFNL